jgi:cobalt-zinc-cadmium resistance protein CzcA
VQIDPRKLVKYGLSFKEVMEAPGGQQQAGRRPVLNVGVEQYLVRGLGLVSQCGRHRHHRRGRAQRRADLRARRGRGQGSPRGALRRGHAQRRGSRAGHRAGAHQRERGTVVKAVKAKLAIAQAALPKGIELKAVYDRTEIVDKALGTSTNALIEGSILVAVILFLFLGEFRSAIVVIVTLPLAMLFAFICMQRSACRPT